MEDLVKVTYRIKSTHQFELSQLLLSAIEGGVQYLSLFAIHYLLSLKVCG